MTPEQRTEVVLGPLRIWAVIMALLALTIAYGFTPGLPLKLEVALAIALATALLIAILFMQLRSAAGIVRLAAIAGVTWGSFLFLLSFADMLTR